VNELVFFVQQTRQWAAIPQKETFWNRPNDKGTRAQRARQLVCPERIASFNRRARARVAFHLAEVNRFQ